MKNFNKKNTAKTIGMLRKKSPFLAYLQTHSFITTWGILWGSMFFAASLHLDWLGALIQSTNALLPMLVLSMTLRLVLIPRFLHAHRVHYYCLSAALIGLITALAVRIDAFALNYITDMKLVTSPGRALQAVAKGDSSAHLYMQIKWTCLLISTFAITTISYLMRERKQMIQEAKEQHLQSELKYLRAQINPHFLFNSLNCIYALTVTNDEQAPESVLKLSEMLRYVLDDCTQDNVPLQKEIRYIENYIDFQRIRMGHDADIVWDVQVENLSYPIPPMIFQPIIENCFKHSRIADQPGAFVHLELLQQGELLTLRSHNSKPAVGFATQDKERVGIGIQNVRHRLDLLFPDNYTLNISDDETSYSMELSINFQ